MRVAPRIDDLSPLGERFFYLFPITEPEREVMLYFSGKKLR